MEMEPLGVYHQEISATAGMALGALAVVGAALLFELSRNLAEQHKGRWYAGNGRDVFHFAAALVLATALFINGLPPPLACALAGSASVVPLMVLDWIAPRRRRVAVLLVSLAVALSPAVIAPAAVVRAGNAVALALLPERQ